MKLPEDKLAYYEDVVNVVEWVLVGKLDLLYVWHDAEGDYEEYRENYKRYQFWELSSLLFKVFLTVSLMFPL